MFELIITILNDLSYSFCVCLYKDCKEYSSSDSDGFEIETQSDSDKKSGNEVSSSIETAATFCNNYSPVTPSNARDVINNLEEILSRESVFEIYR